MTVFIKSLFYGTKQETTPVCCVSIKREREESLSVLLESKVFVEITSSGHPSKPRYHTFNKSRHQTLLLLFTKQ